MSLEQTTTCDGCGTVKGKDDSFCVSYGPGAPQHWCTSCWERVLTMLTQTGGDNVYTVAKLTRELDVYKSNINSVIETHKVCEAERRRLEAENVRLSGSDDRFQALKRTTDTLAFNLHALHGTNAELVEMLGKKRRKKFDDRLKALCLVADDEAIDWPAEDA